MRGFLSSEALDENPSYVIVQRLDPALFEDTPISFQLPLPKSVNLERIFEANPGSVLAGQIDDLSRSIGLSLPKEQANTLRSILGSLKNDTMRATTSTERSDALRVAQLSLHRAVSEARYASMMNSIETYVANMMMGTH